jgi:uncharacterized protein (TIRG00374 family)
MRVDGQDIPISGSLLQPLIRRTSDIIRVILSGLTLGLVIAASLITRDRWVALEKSVSGIVGVIPARHANLVYLLYGLAILALPFAILLGLMVGRHWRLLAGYAAAGLIAGLVLSFTGTGLAAPRWHLAVSNQRLDTFLSQFVDDPRWIAMLAAVLTVSSPRLPAGRRRWWWLLLLAFVPMHLFVSAIVPARSMLGLAVGWFVGAVVVWLVGTPALEVPLDTAARVLARRGAPVAALRVLRPAGAGPLLIAATVRKSEVILELYGRNQRSGSALRQFWRWLSFRSSETTALHTSMRRAVEHRALMAIAVADLGVGATTALGVSALDRGWMLYAHYPPRGEPIDESADDAVVSEIWGALSVLQLHQISHGDLRRSELRHDRGTVLLTGFGYAELGATTPQLQSDIAQLLLTTSAMFGRERAVRAALAQLGEDTVLAASARLTKAALPARIRKSVADPATVLAATREELMRQTDTDTIETAQVTRLSRNQIIQLALLIGLVYVAYPYISAVPTFFSALHRANWWWALLGLAVSSLTYLGAAASLWACAASPVSYRDLVVMQVANTFAATTTPAGVGGLALSVRFLHKAGLGGVRATAAVALQQAVQVLTHIGLLIVFSVAAGTSANLSHIVPGPTVIYLLAGAALGVLGTFMFVPKARRWLRNSVRPQLREVLRELGRLAGNPRRSAVIVLGCATTTLGAATALWVSVQAFGGGTTFVAVTVVTMIGGTLAAAAPTPGGVGAVEAALIGGLAAFGTPAGTGVTAVLLYRALTCWLPVLLGWPTMRWLAARDMI